MLSIASRLVLVVGVVAAALVVLRSTHDGGHSSDDRLRFHDVSIDRPPDEFLVNRQPPLTPDENTTFSHRPVFQIFLQDEDVGEVKIDAETGEVLMDTLSARRPELRAVLDSVEVHTELSDAWPLGDRAKPRERTSVGNLSFLSPSAGSGLLVWEIFSYCSAPCADHVMRISGQTPQGNLQLDIDARTGAIVTSSGDSPQLIKAIQRFLDEVQMPAALAP